MHRIFFPLVVFGLLVAPCSLAETIYLKNGEIIKGKVVQRGPYYTTIMKGKVPYRYINNRIDRIEEGEQETDSTTIKIDASQFENIPQHKIDLILDLIEISGIRRNMEQNLQHVVAQAPLERKSELEKLFNVTEIIKNIVPIYDKYYEESELREIIQFYGSPTGQKLLETSPEIMKEIMRASLEYFRSQPTP